MKRLCEYTPEMMQQEEAFTSVFKSNNAYNPEMACEEKIKKTEGRNPTNTRIPFRPSKGKMFKNNGKQSTINTCNHQSVSITHRFLKKRCMDKALEKAKQKKQKTNETPTAERKRQTAAMQDMIRENEAQFQQWNETCVSVQRIVDEFYENAPTATSKEYLQSYLISLQNQCKTYYVNNEALVIPDFDHTTKNLTVKNALLICLICRFFVCFVVCVLRMRFRAKKKRFLCYDLFFVFEIFFFQFW